MITSCKNRDITSESVFSPGLKIMSAGMLCRDMKQVKGPTSQKMPTLFTSRTIASTTYKCNTISKYNAVQYNTMKYTKKTTIQYIALQYTTIQYITLQYNALHYRTVQYITLKYTTIQLYITI